MKIHWTDACKTGLEPIVPLSRQTTLSRLSIMCAAWMCIASATTVYAQSGTEGLQQAGGFSPATAAVQDGVLKHGDKSYRVVDTASYRTAADPKSTSSSDIKQVGHQGYDSGSCSSCGSSSCGGSCGTISMPSETCGTCGTCGTVCGGKQWKMWFRPGQHPQQQPCQPLVVPRSTWQQRSVCTVPTLPVRVSRSFVHVSRRPRL